MTTWQDFRNLGTIKIVAKAFKERGLDWPEDARLELAYIALRALQTNGYQLFEFKP